MPVSIHRPYFSVFIHISSSPAVNVREKGRWKRFLNRTDTWIVDDVCGAAYCWQWQPPASVRTKGQFCVSQETHTDTLHTRMARVCTSLLYCTWHSERTNRIRISADRPVSDEWLLHWFPLSDGASSISIHRMLFFFAAGLPTCLMHYASDISHWSLSSLPATNTQLERRRPVKLASNRVGNRKNSFYFDGRKQQTHDFVWTWPRTQPEKPFLSSSAFKSSSYERLIDLLSPTLNCCVSLDGKKAQFSLAPRVLAKTNELVLIRTTAPSSANYAINSPPPTTQVRTSLTLIHFQVKMALKGGLAAVWEQVSSWTRDKFCVYDTGLKKKQMSVRVDIVAQMQHSWMLTSILHLFFLVWVSGRFFGLLRRPLRLAHLRHFFHVRRKRRLSEETVAKLKTKLLGSHCCGRYLFVTFNNFFKISSVWRP